MKPQTSPASTFQPPAMAKPILAESQIPALGTIFDPATFAENTALITNELAVTYAQLQDRIDRRVKALGSTRRLVLLQASNDIETVVSLLACYQAGHPVIVADAKANPSVFRRWTKIWNPDVTLIGDALAEHRPGTGHDLHPDLALLLSTSGSTGSPKLVRLSRMNLVANATSISEYLRIRPTDKAIASLPLNYCYGLSIIHSNLSRGAAVVLTELSVVDQCFWDLCLDTGATSISGVPYTFDLLNSVAFEQHVPETLRYLTQAGGPMKPERVQAFAELGARSGFDLFVMYGQTEATARMAYLPSEMALTRPNAVGVAIPGGRLSIRATVTNSETMPSSQPELGIGEEGEIVYEGPNIMLGYAEVPADLGKGAEIDVLFTGDRGRIADDGLVEIVGRRSGFMKVRGFRIDIDLLEQTLEVALAVHDDRLWVVAEQADSNVQLSQKVRELTNLPASTIRVIELAHLPRNDRGKLDRVKISELVAEQAALRLEGSPTSAGNTADQTSAAVETVKAIFAMCLGQSSIASSDTFVSIGGDSLSFVEVSTRLSDYLGTLPRDWHTRSVESLAALAKPAGRRSRLVTIEASVVIRAAAIVMIVISHIRIATLQGGAHALLTVFGYNVARFQILGRSRVVLIKGLAKLLAEIAIPTLIWMLTWRATTGRFGWTTITLTAPFFENSQWGSRWQYWFVYVVVYALLLLIALLGLPSIGPAVHRALQRWPRKVPALVLAFSLLLRFGVIRLEGATIYNSSLDQLLWWLVLGWCAAVAKNRREKVLLSVVAAVGTMGFFNAFHREVTVIIGMWFVIWSPLIRLPRATIKPITTLASASLYIYIVHWEIFRPIREGGRPWLAFFAALAVGIGLWWTVSKLRPLVIGLVTAIWAKPFRPVASSMSFRSE